MQAFKAYCRAFKKVGEREILARTPAAFEYTNQVTEDTQFVFIAPKPCRDAPPVGPVFFWRKSKAPGLVDIPSNWRAQYIFELWPTSHIRDWIDSTLKEKISEQINASLATEKAVELINHFLGKVCGKTDDCRAYGRALAFFSAPEEYAIGHLAIKPVTVRRKMMDLKLCLLHDDWKNRGISSWSRKVKDAKGQGMILRGIDTPEKLSIRMKRMGLSG